jgi:hypothetical protein
LEARWRTVTFERADGMSRGRVGEGPAALVVERAVEVSAEDVQEAGHLSLVLARTGRQPREGAGPDNGGREQHVKVRLASLLREGE